jgi:hypothetical protein
MLKHVISFVSQNVVKSTLILACAVSLISPAAVCQPKNPTASARIDLQRLGFRPYIQKYKSDAEFFKHPSFFDDYNARMAFLDDDTLLVYYVRKDEATSPDKGKANRGALVLEALIIDWPSQSLGKHEEWTTVSRRAISTTFDSQSMIFPLAGRRFLVHANDQLLLYSKEGQILQKRPLPVASTKGETWNVRVAPGGRTFVLRHMYLGQAENEWIDAESFGVRAKSSDNFGLASASEVSLAAWQLGKVVLHKIGAQPEVICATAFCVRSSQTFFLEGNEILLQTQNGFHVLTSAGQVLWSKEDPTITINGVLGAEVSLTGNLFALSVSSRRKLSFDGFELLPEANLIVYDRETRRSVLAVHLKGGSCCANALSPEGRYLAVLEPKSVLIYDLQKNVTIPAENALKHK